MFHNAALHFLSHTDKMLKSLNNNATPFSVDNLLSREKLSPEHLDHLDELDDFKSRRFPAKAELSPDSSPSGGDRLSPEEVVVHRAAAFDVGCFKSRLCANCGRLECASLQCRLSVGNTPISQAVTSSGEGIMKDNKPVLKFSVSAILGSDAQRSGGGNGNLDGGGGGQEHNGRLGVHSNGKL